MSDDLEAHLACVDGYEAYHNGDSPESCKHPSGTYLFDCWHDGFDSAKQTNERGKLNG